MSSTTNGEAESPGLLIMDVVHQLRSQVQLLAIRLERLTEHVAPAGMGVHGRLTADLERLGGSLYELLDLDGARQGRGPVAVDVVALLAERADSWSDIAASVSLDLHVAPASPTRVLAWPGAVERIVDILLDNAVKYARWPGRISVAVRRNRTTATVEVVDQGPGLTAQECAAATGRGWRGGTGSGQGLGLAIAERLAAAGGGRLGISPGPQGRGLRASVEFPLVDTRTVT